MGTSLVGHIVTSGAIDQDKKKTRGKRKRITMAENDPRKEKERRIEGIEQSEYKRTEKSRKVLVSSRKKIQENGRV